MCVLGDLLFPRGGCSLLCCWFFLCLVWPKTKLNKLSPPCCHSYHWNRLLPALWSFHLLCMCSWKAALTLSDGVEEEEPHSSLTFMSLDTLLCEMTGDTPAKPSQSVVCNKESSSALCTLVLVVLGFKVSLCCNTALWCSPVEPRFESYPHLM